MIFKYVIVCFLVFIAGFVDAIAGGGGLITLPAYMMAGLPAHTAIGTNKLSSAMGTSVASYHYWEKGFMKWKLCVPAVIGAVVGSFAGSNLNLWLDDDILKKVMVVILPLIGIYVFFKKDLEANTKDPFGDRKTIVLCTLAAVVIGFYDGLYGPGTGTFLMLVLTAVCRLKLNDAAGTTKAINLTTNVISLAVYLFNGKTLILLGLCAGACNMVGAYLGSHNFSKNGAKIARPTILIVLAIFFVKIVLE